MLCKDAPDLSLGRYPQCIAKNCFISYIAVIPQTLRFVRIVCARWALIPIINTVKSRVWQ